MAESRRNPGSGAPAQVRGQRFAGQAQLAAVTAVSPRDVALSLPGTIGSSFLLSTMGCGRRAPPDIAAKCQRQPSGKHSLTVAFRTT